MKEQILKDTIEQTQKILEQNKDWHTIYDKQVSVLLENRPLIDQFKKLTKEYESKLQFYLTEITPTPTDLFTITTKYMGTAIATITISKDKIQITTEEYNKSNNEDGIIFKQ